MCARRAATNKARAAKKPGSRPADARTGPPGRRTSLAALYNSSPMERIALVKAGVPAELVNVLAQDMAITKDKLYKTIGVARATVDRKVRAKALLDPDESERVLGIARLVGQVDQMGRESGAPEDFDAAKWVAAWLDRPLAALGGAQPGTLMDTSEGRAIVSDLLAQMQSGAYA